MGLVYQGMPPDLLALVQRLTGARTFIETGTNLGGSAAFAAETFQRVWTIEAQPHLHTQAKARLDKLENVEAILGNSETGLARMIVTVDGPAVCWLDAHWSGGETAGELNECPVLDEIRSIDTAPVEHVLLIDDARLFLQPPPRPHKIEHWPSIAELADVARARWPQAYLAVIDDVIVRVPGNLRGPFCESLRDKLDSTAAAPYFKKRRKSLRRRLFGA